MLTLIFIRSSGELHPLSDHSSSLYDFTDLLTHGLNGSFMKLELKIILQEHNPMDLFLIAQDPLVTAQY